MDSASSLIRCTVTDHGSSMPDVSVINDRGNYWEDQRPCDLLSDSK